MAAVKLWPAAFAALLLVAAAPAAAVDTSVDTGDFFYKPYRVSVQPGDTVTWRILEGSEHSVTTRRSAPAQFDSGLKAPGQTFAHEFTVPGRYAIYCTIHPGQDGVVQVGPDTTDPRLTRLRVRRGERAVRLRFRLSEEARVRASIFRDGNRVKRIRTGVLRAGARSIPYRPGTLRPGAYRARLVATDVEGNSAAAVSKRFTVPAS